MQNTLPFKKWLKDEAMKTADAEHSPEMRSALVAMYKHNESGLRTALRIYGMTASMVAKAVLAKFEEMEKREEEEQSRLKDERE